ncbi:MAG: branched-chain amino acid ABC transporter permease, partial [Mesorhizobium sp.]
MLYFFQQVLNGLHSGALYALLAFGYVLTNGILHRTNLAYGALFAFCGQTMILTAAFGYQALWLTLFAAVALGIVAAFLYAGLISYVLSRSIFEPLADRTPNAIVVTTLGILLLLSEASRIAADTHD